MTDDRVSLLGLIRKGGQRGWSVLAAGWHATLIARGVDADTVDQIVARMAGPYAALAGRPWFAVPDQATYDAIDRAGLRPILNACLGELLQAVFEERLQAELARSLDLRQPMPDAAAVVGAEGWLQ